MKKLGRLFLLVLSCCLPTYIVQGQTCTCATGCSTNGITSANGREVNVAYGKTASMSSTATGPACRAANGQIGTVLDTTNCVQTGDTDKNAWWQVDLGADYTVSSIVIYRVTGQQKRMTDILVQVDGVTCHDFKGNGNALPEKIDITCVRALTGRIVKFQKDPNRKENVINMCEVQVWVCADGYYGTTCAEDCGNCAIGDVCDRVTGACPNGCQSGFTPLDPLCKQASAIAITNPNPDGSTTIRLNEGPTTPTGTNVLTVTSNPALTPPITFTAVKTGGTTDVSSDFIVNGATLRTTKLLDFETTPSYTITVTANDGAGTTAVAVFILQVTDINDETPVFSNTNIYSVTWNEEQGAGSTVFPVFTVTDPDAGDSLTFSLSGAQSSYFTVDPSTGRIVADTKLDRDAAGSITTFNQLTLTVTDAAGNAVSKALTMTLQDINDNAPVCNPALYTPTVAENTATGTSVTTLTCSDIDAGVNSNIVSYVITSGDNAPSKFVMVNNEMQTTSTPLNFETKSSYSLVVDVIDGGTPAKTGQVNVVVVVSNVNDNTPVWGTFAPPGTTFTVPESLSVGSTVVTLTATDADSGSAGEVEYSLMIVTDSGGIAAPGLFSLGATSGNVVTTSMLDTDSGVTSYTLVVRAQDKGSPVKFVGSTLTVNLQDVNDNAPVFNPNSYQDTVWESLARIPWEISLRVTATDADRTTGALLYTITGGNDLNKFAFDNLPGSRDMLILNADIDVDAPTSDPSRYVLTVEASDQGVPGTPALTGTATVTITIDPFINDHDPVYGTTIPVSPTISETAAVGTTVATIPVTDNDRDNNAAQTITMAITGGNTNNDFSLDPILGVLTTAHPLDFERTASYSLIIEASDNGTPARTGTLTLVVTVVNVNDNAPSCTSYNPVAEVEEQTAAQPVYTLTCTDSDVGTTLSYSIFPAVATFTVSTTGVVSTLTPLNYEAATSYSLKIEVRDSMPTIMTSTVTMVVNVQHVNEFNPVFNPNAYTAVLAENVIAGTSVTTVSATDFDKGSLDGTIRYRIVSGNGLGAFIIDTSTGLISTTNIGLDRETTAIHTLTIRASDDVPGSATERTADVTVIVTVTDTNDKTPRCTPANYQTNITEPSVLRAVVLTLTTTDDDETGTPNASPSISVTGGNTGDVFGTNGYNLVLDKVVDYETRTSYALTITVTDGGTPALSSTCDVAVTILPANEFPPVLSETQHSTDLLETAAVGTIVYDAAATDADSNLGSVVTYNITSGNTNNDFFIYPNTGVVVVWNRLDYDMPPQTYALTVEARDDTGLADTVLLNIQLTDSNDQTPVFRRNTYTVTVDENVANDTEVVVVKAVDTDIGVGGTITYTAVSGNGMSLFAVDAGTGAVTTTGALDRETRRDYSLLVRASDGGTPSLSSTALVAITVNDLNDNAPVFTPSDFTVSVQEGATAGTSVTTVTAKDADSVASNNVFSYVLNNAFFRVGSSSGVVSIKTALDREVSSSYVLKIIAPDEGAPVRRGTATVTVLIDDINDNTPVITGTYNPRIPENSGGGDIVTTIVATDADTGDNARLTYTIVSGNTNNDFIISDVSGIIQVAKSLNREQYASYDLVVEVNDNGNPKLTATTTVTVTITDINDNAPVWNQASYAFFVSENVAVGESVGQVTATDADISVNAALTYSVVLFWTGNASHFSLDGATGLIRTTAILDRESTAQYTAWLRVTDDGNPQLHADVNVSIAVNDLNDNAPVFNLVSYTATTIENDPVGTGVLTVTVTDRDIGTNAAVTLSIDTSTTAGARAATFFQVTSGTGVVSVKSVIDRETDTSFNFTLLATDGGSPSHTSSADVIITVVDVNDHAPIFSPTYYNTEIAYTGLCTKSIVTVTATDADSGTNGRVSYFLQTPALSDLFLMDATSGELSLKSSISPSSMHDLKVSAQDGGTPTQTSSPQAQIRVDGMIPSDVVNVFKLGITTSAFLAQRSVFLQQLQTVVRATYPTALARLWCAETNSDGLANAYVYFLSDDSTESVANSNAAKYYLSQDIARSFFTSDAAGSPGSVLSGSEWSAFNIKSIQPYKETQTPWAKTWEGIAIITACCIVGLALLFIATFMIVRLCRQCARNRPLKKKRKFVDESRTPTPPNKVEPLERLTPVERPQGFRPQPVSEYGEGFFWHKKSPF